MKIKVKQWLKHLWYWILTFPIGDYHTYSGIVGSSEYYCLCCGKKETFQDMSFNRVELEKMMLSGLLRLATYLGIQSTDETEKSEIIDKIMAELDKRSSAYRDFNGSEDVAITQPVRYSVRVQRIMDQKAKGELK